MAVGTIRGRPVCCLVSLLFSSISRTTVAALLLDCQLGGQQHFGRCFNVSSIFVELNHIVSLQSWRKHWNISAGVQHTSFNANDLVKVSLKKGFKIIVESILCPFVSLRVCGSDGYFFMTPSLQRVAFNSVVGMDIEKLRM